MDALLIVDMQVGCFEGEPPRFDAEGTVQRVNALAQRMRDSGCVVFIQHTDVGQGYARDSREWQIVPGVTIHSSDVIIEKIACDAFLETDLDRILRNAGVDRVLVVGCATDFCVDTTVRSAAAHGYNVVVPSDGHTTRDRPHLSATQIITHHNYMWADLLLPRGARIKLMTTQELLAVRSGPNQALEPTTTAVTICAGAQLAPAVVVAHL